MNLIDQKAPSNRNPDGTFFAWDSTMLKSYEKCPQYFKYKMIDGWQPGRKSVHLTFGGHYATALEHYHKHRALGMSLDDALIEVVHEALIATWEIVGAKDGQPIGKPWESFDNNKTRETLIRSIIWYVDFFAEEDSKTIILADGVPAVEYSFKLLVDNGIFLCGHLDRVCEMTGDYFLMDQKTTGSTITPHFFDQFNPDMQMSLYSYCGKAIFDIPIRGVIIDAAQIAVGFTRYERGFTFRTESQLEEWYDDTMCLIDDANQAILNNHFIKNTSSCGNYGGCEFRGICSKSPEVREKFLPAEFSKSFVWNPLESR
jgi:hypothetical protein